MDFGGWKPYVPVAERRRKALRELEKQRKKGQSVSPVIIEGRTIAKTFWGKSLVREPGEVQRLCESPAARPNVCPQRFGYRSANPARGHRRHGQRLIPVPGLAYHHAGSEDSMEIDLL